MIDVEAEEVKRVFICVEVYMYVCVSVCVCVFWVCICGKEYHNVLFSTLALETRRIASTATTNDGNKRKKNNKRKRIQD